MAVDVPAGLRTRRSLSDHLQPTRYFGEGWSGGAPQWAPGP